MDNTLAETLTGWRRHLHAHPELTLHEQETAAFVCDRLRELGVPFAAGIGGHGVVATISRGRVQSQRRPARRHGRAADRRDDRSRPTHRPTRA